MSKLNPDTMSFMRQEVEYGMVYASYPSVDRQERGDVTCERMLGCSLLELAQRHRHAARLERKKTLGSGREHPYSHTAGLLYTTSTVSVLHYQ